MSNTNTYDKSFPVSWEEIHRNSKALAWRLSELKPYKGIIAVTRGGLVPAAIVARELDIRLIPLGNALEIFLLCSNTVTSPSLNTLCISKKRVYLPALSKKAIVVPSDTGLVLKLKL